MGCNSSKICVKSPGVSERALRESTVSTVSLYSLAGIRTQCKMVSCYDGDTVTLNMVIGGEIRQYKCRLFGIDCPEMKPTLDAPNRILEKIDAVNAKAYIIGMLTDQRIPDMLPKTSTESQIRNYSTSLDELVRNNQRCVEVVCGDWDKYGRLLVTFPLKSGGTVSDEMIRHGHGYSYVGGTKNRSKYEKS